MNIVYNASAGTGKTWQVTRLYEELVLEEGVDPREILLMTFTDNAAAELRLRVAHRLLQARRTAETEGNDALLERAVSAGSKLASAPIGTIHSFCTRLLREHALEAGLSPEFSVLAGEERDEVLHQICRDEVLARLESDPDFKTFCAGAHIIGSGNGFGTSITETVPRLMDQASSLGISLENAEQLLPKPDDIPVSRFDFEQICRRIEKLPNMTPTVQSALQIIQQAIDETENVESLVTRMNERGIKKFGRGGAKEISDAFWKMKTTVEEAVMYRDRFPAAQAFARYVQAVVQAFELRKHRMNAVDFDDQLRMAQALLKDVNAAPAFRYIIVDEVQDTSRIQCDIIQSMWQESTELVICGDKKQSIYTWRGADPQVMPDLEKAILQAGGKPHNLQTSYRSKGPILDVVNKLFTAVYDEDDYTRNDNLEPRPEYVVAGEKPCIEFLSPDEGTEEWTRPEKVAAEMEAVANRIQLLVKGAPDWKPKYRYSDEEFLPTGKSNAYRYSDILILLRRTAHQSVLEQALRHAGIPYTLGGKGRGLFTRQETRDIALFLNVLTDPKDAYSLVGFLRSPWVGFSDETIAELAWSNGGFSVDHLMARYKEKTDLIDRYRSLLGTSLASELVRMLIDETGYDALLAAPPRGAQKVANMRKVIDWLRETERGAQTTPAAVARKLAHHIAHPPQIPEAALLDPAQDAVTIMTVHSAKGLTKRVVFVPDMSFTGNPDRSLAQVFFDDDEPKLGVRITSPDRTRVKSPAFDQATKRVADIRKHESNNLFYVAMTRARDLVVTSASIGKRSSEWYKHMEPFIETDIPAIPYSLLADAAEKTAITSRQIPTTDQLRTALRSLPPIPEKPTLQRISATRLARELDELETSQSEWEESTIEVKATSSAMGSLGHAVLEQLAYNKWQGSTRDWLETLRTDFVIGRTEAGTLEKRIERARKLMTKLTSDVDQLQPEFPFVLLDQEKLIDGTIDLLCRTNTGFALFDYKFTDASEEDIMSSYRGQMEIYYKAARRCYPQAKQGEVNLIAISHKEVKCIPLLF